MRISDSLYIKSLSGNSVTIDGSIQSNLFVVTNDGFIGIGTATPTEKLELNGNIKLVDTTKYIKGGTGWIDFYNGTGIALTSDNASWAKPYVWVDGVTAIGQIPMAGLFEDGLNQKNILILQGDSSQSLLTITDRGLLIFDDKAILKHLTKIEIDSPFVGIGKSSTSARLHVVGVDNTSSNYSLKVESASASSLLNVRNDGNVGIGISNPIHLLDIEGPANSSLYLKSTGANGSIIVDSLSYPIFQLRTNGAVDINHQGLGSGNSLIDIPTSLQFRDGLSIARAGFINMNSISTTFFRNNVVFDPGLSGVTPTAAVHIKGSDLSSGTYSLKIDNSGNANLFSVRNDGQSVFNTTIDTWGTYTFNSTGGNVVSINGNGVGSYAGVIFNTEGSSRLFIDTNATGARIRTQGTTNLYIARGTSESEQIIIGSGYIEMEALVGVSIGKYGPSISARLHISGTSSTSSGYALKIESASASSLLSVRNDGLITGNGMNTSSTFVIGQSGGHIGAGGSFTIGDMISDSNFVFIIKGANYPALKFESVYGTNTSITQQAGGNGVLLSTNALSKYLRLTPDSVGINIPNSEYITEASLDIRGATSNSSSYAVKMTNADSQPLLYIRNDGNVGIGVSASTTKLHVYGTQSGAFRLQDTTQGSGKVLTSDVNGVGTWASIGVIGIGTTNKSTDTRGFTASITETITHNLNTSDVFIQNYDSTGLQIIAGSILITGTGSVDIKFSQTLSNVKTVIIG